MRQRRPSTQPVDLDFIFSRSMPEPNSGCWIWMGAVSSRGYGTIGFQGRGQRTSRVVMQLVTGTPVPADLYVCHRCDNPYCVNPDHLFVGTPTDNTRDCVAKGRHVAPTGFRHGKSVITPEMMQAIRASRGRSQWEVARELGIHRSTVQRALYGETYRDEPIAAAERAEG